MTLRDWPWRHWRVCSPHAPALELENETLSWQQLGQRVDSLASGFAQQGVKAGDGVALLARNSGQTVLAWLALLQCGARVWPVNPQLPEALIQRLLPGLTIRWGLALEAGKLLAGCTPLCWQDAPGAYAEAWQPQRLVSMTLTSGSTGTPKAAVHSAAAHLASAAGVLSLIAFAPGDCWLLSLPLYHVSGQGILWRWLLAGAQMKVRPQQPLHEALAGCSHASLVPTQLWRLLESGVTPPTLHAVLLGGAAIPVVLVENARKRGIRCWCGYGLTEMASTVCAKPADGGPDVGSPLPGREVRVVNQEVWLRADSMASGYWRDGELLPLVNAQGWFATGDRGVWHDGRLSITGRLDNLFFSGGESIQPEEIERIIAAHPQVEQVMVVARDDEEFGQRPVALVRCPPDVEPASLASWLEGKLARFQYPVAWLRFPEALLAGGIKPPRKALQAWVASQTLGT